MQDRLNKIFDFFVLVLFLLLPVNLAKHFILPEAYVNGVLVDYLVPSFYATDFIVLGIIFTGTLLALTKKESIKRLLSLPFAKNLSFLLLGFLVVLFLSSVSGFDSSSPSPVFSFYKFLKIFEMVLTAFFISLFFDFRANLENLSKVLSLSVLFESVLGFLQILGRGSFFDNYLMFGEQPYSALTPGIALSDTFGVVTALPYGTFPHPNAFAAFLVISLTVLIFYTLAKKVHFLPVAAISSGAMLLVFLGSYVSLVVFAAALLFFFMVLETDFKKSTFVLVVLLALGAVLNIYFMVYGTQSENPSIYRRSDLLNASAKMVNEKPFAGVGLNKFTVFLEDFGGVRGVIRFVQPVHNVYALTAAESGLPALALLFAFHIFVFYKLFRFRCTLEIILFFEVLFFGLFDHFTFTLQQGMLIHWLTLGATLNTIILHEKKSAWV